MNISRKSFQAAFDKVAPLAGKRTHLPILSSVRLSDNNGELEIMASNLDCFATAKCQIDGSMKPICVSASLLGGLLKSANEEITLELLKGDRLKFVSNGTAEIACLPADEFPVFPDGKAKAVGINTADLAELIKSVAWAADTNDANGIMRMAVWIKAEPKSLTCAATNGVQLAHVKRPLICAECECMIPAAFAGELAEVLKEDGSTFLLSQNYAIAESASLVVAVKLIEGNYFNLNQILKQEKSEIGEIQPKAVLSAMSTVMMLSAGSEFNATTMTFTNDGVGVEFKSPTNHYKTQIPAKVKGDPIRVDAGRASLSFRNLEAETVKASYGVNGALFLISGDSTAILHLLREKKP